jgi:hypothetical protein
VRNRAFYLYPIGAAIGAGIYFASGHPSVLFNLIGLSSPLLILVAVRVHKPERRLPWILFAVGQMLFIAGDVIAYNYEKFSHVMPGVFKLTPDGTPFPSWGDPFYLGVYPCLIGGVLLLIRSRMAGRDRASLIDALMLAIGTGALSWVYLISPLANSDSPTIVKLVSMAYPIMDLLLVAALIRLTVGTGRRPPSHAVPTGQRLARDRLDGLLRLVGDGGAAPFDGRDVGAHTRCRDETDEDPPRDPRQRIVDRPRDHGDPARSA